MKLWLLMGILPTTLFAGAALAQVAVPVLNMTDATRCAAGIEMTIASPSAHVGNLYVDQYLQDHQVAPAMDLIFSADLSSAYTAQLKSPSYVYKTKTKGRLATCLFQTSDDGVVHYLMQVWIRGK